MAGNTMLILGIVVSFLFSLPYWLPSMVIRLRTFIFTKVNGDEGIQIPGKEIDASEFKRVYAHKSAAGRSKGANLSNLFWYWLSPGAEMHQEHIEKWDNYDQIAAVTKKVLSVSNKEIEELLHKCATPIFLDNIKGKWKLVRLRDFIMPICVDFFYELVFKEVCSKQDQKVIIKHSSNVVGALKCCVLRDMPKRNQLTELLVSKLKLGLFPYDFPENYTLEDKALYIQGVFFTTAIVQMSDALTHTFLVLARHNDVQTKLSENLEDRRFLDNVISETLRLYPLFGIAHRVTTDSIELENNKSIAKGAVLCFNYPDFHKIGYTNPSKFIPERWDTISKGESNYLPFGIGANRPCPASHMSLIMMKKMITFGTKQFKLFSSVEHTRSLPNKGACILVSRNYTLSRRKKAILLAFLKVRDQWEKVYTSLVQLVYGFIMIMHARDLKLTTNYYKNPHSKDVSKTIVSKELFNVSEQS